MLKDLTILKAVYIYGLLTVTTVILSLPVHLLAFDLDCGVAWGSGHTFNNGWIISKASCAEMTEKP